MFVAKENILLISLPLKSIDELVNEFPGLTPVFISKKGAILGLFLIIVTSSSVTKLSSAANIFLCSTTAVVFLFKSLISVPCIDLGILIF